MGLVEMHHKKAVSSAELVMAYVFGDAYSKIFIDYLEKGKTIT